MDEIIDRHNFLSLVPNEKYLYHYTTLDCAFEHILHKGTLKLSSLNTTNDPREFKDWNWTISNEPYDIERGLDYFEKKIERQMQINTLIKSGCKLCCFSSDNYSDDLMKVRGWDHPRMWAQYADRNKGVCLIFNKEKLIQTVEEELKPKGELYYGYVKYLRLEDIDLKIDYRKIEKYGIDSLVGDLIKANYEQYFFSKHHDWRQESEFRILMRSNNLLKNDNDKEDYFSIHNSIEAIICGSKFPKDAYEPLVAFHRKKYNIKYGVMNWHNGTADVRLL